MPRSSQLWLPSSFSEESREEPDSRQATRQPRQHKLSSSPVLSKITLKAANAEWRLGSHLIKDQAGPLWRTTNRLGLYWTSWLVLDRGYSRRDSSGGLQWHCGICSSLAGRCNRCCWVLDPSCSLVWSNARRSRGAWIANHQKGPDELHSDRVRRDYRNPRPMAVHTIQVRTGSSLRYQAGLCSPTCVSRNLAALLNASISFSRRTNPWPSFS